LFLFLLRSNLLQNSTLLVDRSAVWQDQGKQTLVVRSLLTPRAQLFLFLSLKSQRGTQGFLFVAQLFSI
jgi:hypothetical protein